MAAQTETFMLGGGLNLDTSYLNVPQGSLLECINYECPNRGGYRKIGGYVAYDGSADPSANALSGAVPGNGPVRGVCIYRNELYAFRDQATEGGMFKETPSGWGQVDLGTSLDFKTGEQTPEEDDVIIGALSSAQATIKRINVSGGLIDSSSLQGTLVLDNITGTFQDNEELQIDGIKFANADGAQYANSLPLGGYYEFDNENFYGSDSLERMYGVNGVGNPFEWDGEYFVPISTGVNLYFPSNIACHKDHLFLGYETGSILTSSQGSPTKFEPLTGAGEIAVGDNVTGFFKLTGGVLAVGCRDSIRFVYGNDSTSWSVQRFAPHGIHAKTVQSIGRAGLALDDRGVQFLTPTDQFGDFSAGTVSEPIARDLLAQIDATNATASVTNKKLSQYRLFFNSTGYYFTFTAESITGITKVEFANDVLCACNGEEASGSEISFFGSSNGFVYKMDTSNFFAGAPIPTFLRLPYIQEGATTRRKMYRKICLETYAIGAPAELLGRAKFDFSNSISSTPYRDGTPSIVGSPWGKSAESSYTTPTNADLVNADPANAAIWDEFIWGNNQYRGQICFDITGHGTDMSMSVYNNGIENANFTFYSATVHFSPRRLER